MASKHPLFTSKICFSAFRLVSSLASTLLMFYRLRDYSRIPSFHYGDADVNRMLVQDDLIAVLFVWTVGTAALANLHNLITYFVYLFDGTNVGFLIYSFILDLLLSTFFLMLGTIQMVRNGLGLGLTYVFFCLSASTASLACSYLDIAMILILKALLRQPGFVSSQPSSRPSTTVVREKQPRNNSPLAIITDEQQSLNPENPLRETAQTGGSFTRLNTVNTPAQLVEPSQPQSPRVISTVEDVLDDPEDI